MTGACKCPLFLRLRLSSTRSLDARPLILCRIALTTKIWVARRRLSSGYTHTHSSCRGPLAGLPSWCPRSHCSLLLFEFWESWYVTWRVTYQGVSRSKVVRYSRLEESCSMHLPAPLLATLMLPSPVQQACQVSCASFPRNAESDKR